MTYAELDYQDEYFEGQLQLEVSYEDGEIVLDDVTGMNGDYYDLDDNHEIVLDRIAAKLYDQWGNGFGWEEKVRI